MYRSKSLRSIRVSVLNLPPSTERGFPNIISEEQNFSSFVLCADSSKTHCLPLIFLVIANKKKTSDVIQTFINRSKNSKLFFRCSGENLVSAYWSGISMAFDSGGSTVTSFGFRGEM